MPETRSSRNDLALALAAAIREVAERRAAERAERRATLSVVEQRRGGQAA
jgi:hypothetical protein